MGRRKKEEEEAELTADLALAQAANTLILATEKAEYDNDSAALMKIAGGWMEIHEYLAGTHVEEDKKTPLGFTNAHTIEAEEEEELDDAIAAEGRGTTSNGVRGLYPQHGKFRVTSRRHRN